MWPQIHKDDLAIGMWSYWMLPECFFFFQKDTMILAFQEGFVLPGPSSPRSAFQYHFSVILIVILNGERISLQPVLPTSVVRCLHLSVPAKMFRGCGAPDGELLCGHWSMSTRRKSISIPDVPLWMKNEERKGLHQISRSKYFRGSEQSMLNQQRKRSNTNVEDSNCIVIGWVRTAYSFQTSKMNTVATISSTIQIKKTKFEDKEATNNTTDATRY